MKKIITWIILSFSLFASAFADNMSFLTHMWEKINYNSINFEKFSIWEENLLKINETESWSFYQENIDYIRYYKW